MNRYEDMLELPHHISPTRPRMCRKDRAAQFSPFAALAGYESAIFETGRLTGERIRLTEEAKSLLDQKQQLLAQWDQPPVAVTRFLPDKRKEGGCCLTVTGHFRRIDPIRRLLLLTEGEEIPLDDVLELDSPLFRDGF